MTYEGFAVDDDLFLQVLDAARRLGLLVMVHAENDAGIRRTRRRLLELGRTELRYHAVAHSEIMEREATHRALALAEITGARIAIVHISSAQSCEEVTRARARGVDVLAETCPQYVFVSAATSTVPQAMPSVSSFRRRRAGRTAIAISGGRSKTATSILVIGPLALPQRRQARQIRLARLRHHDQRHSRHRDPAAAAVLGRLSGPAA